MRLISTFITTNVTVCATLDFSLAPQTEAYVALSSTYVKKGTTSDRHVRIMSIEQGHFSSSTLPHPGESRSRPRTPAEAATLSPRCFFILSSLHHRRRSRDRFQVGTSFHKHGPVKGKAHTPTARVPRVLSGSTQGQEQKATAEGDVVHDPSLGLGPLQTPGDGSSFIVGADNTHHHQGVPLCLTPVQTSQPRYSFNPRRVRRECGRSHRMGAKQGAIRELVSSGVLRRALLVHPPQDRPVPSRSRLAYSGPSVRSIQAGLLFGAPLPSRTSRTIFTCPRLVYCVLLLGLHPGKYFLIVVTYDLTARERKPTSLGLRALFIRTEMTEGNVKTGGVFIGTGKQIMKSERR